MKPSGSSATKRSDFSKQDQFGEEDMVRLNCLNIYAGHLSDHPLLGHLHPACLQTGQLSSADCATDFSENAFLQITKESEETEEEGNQGTSADDDNDEEVSSVTRSSEGADDKEANASPVPIPKDKTTKKCVLPDGMYICFLSINFTFMVIGFVLVVFGVMVVNDAVAVQTLLKQRLPGRLANVDLSDFIRDGSPMFVLIGCIILFVALVGIVGMLTSSIKILNLYGFFIALAIGSELVGGVMVLVKRKSISKDIKDSMLHSMKESYDGLPNSSSLFSQSLDAVQVYFQCCGVEDYRDFNDTPWYRHVNNLPEPTTPYTGNGTTPFAISISTTTISALTNNASMTVVTPPPSLRLFPDTCCETSVSTVITAASAGSLKLVDPDCPQKNVSLKNPNTAIGCFDRIEAFLFNQGIFIASLFITILGIEVSAISNTRSVIGQLVQKREDKAKAIAKAERERQEAARALAEQEAAEAEQAAQGDLPETTSAPLADAFAGSVTSPEAMSDQFLVLHG